jgi:hypothetical protein
MVKYISVFLCIFCMSCAGADIKKIEIPRAQFEKTDAFVLNSTIQKPPRPHEILLDQSFQITSSEPEYIAFSVEEFSKIVALSKAFDSQSDLISQLENLINLRIEEVNALKEIIATKELLSEHIAVLYLNEQEMRRIDRRNFTVEKLFNKAFLILQSGVIIALAITM